MTDQEPRPVRPQPAGPVRTRPTPWPMIAGVAVLGVLAIAMLAVLLTRDPNTGTASGSSTPSPSETASPSASATESSPASSPIPSDGGSGAQPSLDQLELLTLVVPVVEGVTLREEPRMGGERIGTLDQGAENVVVEGPVDADGYSWYRLAAVGLPPSSGCITPLPTDPLECPIWFGWAAAGNPDEGEAWFEVAEPDCPDPDAETHDFMSLPQRMPLVCYGSDKVSFTAWYSETQSGREECDADPSIAWLYCDDAGQDVWPSESEAVAFERLFIDPEAGISLPERGQWLRLTGAFDHPDSAACGEANGEEGLYDSDDLAVLECRIRYVVTAVEATTAP